MNVLDLFSGIGGFSLGLERAGMRTVAFCEIDPYCRAVLRKHWPGVPIFEDIRSTHAAALPAGIDIVCGGFPCQDISHAAADKAKGLAGERSGLWFEMRRIVRELRPAWVLVENVPRLRVLGADEVLSGLEEEGYTARPLVVGALHAGADHIRQRAWIVANANGQGKYAGAVDAEMARTSQSDADTGRERCEMRQGLQGHTEEHTAAATPFRRAAEPSVARTIYGLPGRVDRVRALGNAVVPQVVEVIGRAIMSVEQSGEILWS